METRYVITIYVTAEEEQAIADLYHVRRWTLHKLGTDSFESSQDETLKLSRENVESAKTDDIAENVPPDKDDESDGTESVDSESTISVDEYLRMDKPLHTDATDSCKSNKSQQLSAPQGHIETCATETVETKEENSCTAIISTTPVISHSNAIPQLNAVEGWPNRENVCDKSELLTVKPDETVEAVLANTVDKDRDNSMTGNLNGKTNSGHQVTQVENEMKCDICKLELNDLDLFNGHQQLDCAKTLNEAKTEDGFHCQVCQITIFLSHTFIRHKLNGTCNTSGCWECGVGFTNPSMYREHQNVICGDMLQAAKRDSGYCCKRCCTTFKTTANYMAHKLNRSCYGLLLNCEFCGKTYPSRRRHCFTQHLKRHLNDRQFMCQTCGKAYLNKETLRDHMRLHTGERPYKCHYCSQEFTTGSHRRNHEMLKHIDVPRSHVCDKCGAAFQFRARLTHHMDIVHSDQRNFPCDQCNKKFKTNTLLKQHKKIHGTVKNHVCEICGRGYIMEKYLRTHMRRHSEKHKHFCDECGKGFFTKQPLLVHERIHTGVKPYSCTLCDYRCNCRGNMNKHLKTIHNKDQPGAFIKKVS